MLLVAGFVRIMWNQTDSWSGGGDLTLVSWGSVVVGWHAGGRGRTGRVFTGTTGSPVGSVPVQQHQAALRSSTPN